MNIIIKKAVIYGIIGSLILFGFYFSLLTMLSGLAFAKGQFKDYWYYIIPLSVGFGAQIGLFTYLKNAIHAKGQSTKVIAVTGTTSTLSMISCCAHYLVNLIPVLGVTGFIAFIAQYQIQLFWLGLISNLFGILYITSRILKFKRSV